MNTRTYANRYQFPGGSCRTRVIIDAKPGTCPENMALTLAVTYITELISVGVIPVASKLADISDAGENTSHVKQTLTYEQNGWALSVKISLSLQNRPGLESRLNGIIGLSMAEASGALDLLINYNKMVDEMTLTLDGLLDLIGLDLNGAKPGYPAGMMSRMRPDTQHGYGGTFPFPDSGFRHGRRSGI